MILLLEFARKIHIFLPCLKGMSYIKCVLFSGLFVDLSLVCKGQVLRAHKVCLSNNHGTFIFILPIYHFKCFPCQVVLSSSSKYFRDFFRHQPGVNIIDLDKANHRRSPTHSTVSSQFHPLQ
jgi:hypothetical protein